MEEKLIQQLYITETLDEVRKSYLSIHYRKFSSLLTMAVVFLIFGFIIDSSFQSTFWICISICVFEIVWYFISVFSSTQKVMNQYKKLEPKPTRVSLYENHFEIYIESNGATIDNKMSYEELNKIIYNEKKQIFVFYKKRNTFNLPEKFLSNESKEFLKTKLKS